MKERIKEVMDSENMNPARFADSLQIGRAVISHILNGRNNPSLDVITRILNYFPNINADWLLSGSGSMYKVDSSPNSNNISESGHQEANKIDIPPSVVAKGFYQSDLFAETVSNKLSGQTLPEYRKDNELKEPVIDDKPVVNERIVYKEKPNKNITRIIIYYSDNTFETFEAGK